MNAVQQRRALTAVTRELAKLRVKRDRLIREMHENGQSLRCIAEVGGLSHAGVKKIIERAP